MPALAWEYLLSVTTLSTCPRGAAVRAAMHAESSPRSTLQRAVEGLCHAAGMHGPKKHPVAHKPSPRLLKSVGTISVNLRDMHAIWFFGLGTSYPGTLLSHSVCSRASEVALRLLLGRTTPLLTRHIGSGTHRSISISQPTLQCISIQDRLIVLGNV